MADNLVSVGSGFLKRFKDMLDGTHAEVVVTRPTREVGLTQKGSVSVTGTDVVVVGGTFAKQVLVQNTDSTKTLYLSFTSPATTTDICLAPGGSLNLNFGPSNSLYGRGDVAGCTFAVIGA